IHSTRCRDVRVVARLVIGPGREAAPRAAVYVVGAGRVGPADRDPRSVSNEADAADRRREDRRAAAADTAAPGPPHRAEGAGVARPSVALPGAAVGRPARIRDEVDAPFVVPDLTRVIVGAGDQIRGTGAVGVSSTSDAQADGFANVPDVVQVLEGVDGASTKVDGHTTAANVVRGSHHEV